MGLSISCSISTRRAGRRRDGSLAIRPPDAAPRPSFTAYVPAGRAAAMLDLTHRFRAKLEASTVLRYALAPGCIALAALLQMFVTGRLPVWSDSPPPIHPTGL